MSTNFAIVGVEFSPYALRGLTQKLEGIDSSVVARRTINGVLRKVTPDGFEKYKTSISCEDQDPPAFERLVPGGIFEVHCAAELSVAGAEPSDLSTWNAGSRPAVPGSVRWQAGFIFYRPILTMMVLSRSNNLDEWARDNSWSVDLEEV